jgi:isopenicillin-N N-acyltransferase-like protein
MRVEPPPPMEVLDFEGTPVEVGRAHGEALREAIRAHAETHHEWLLANAAVRLDADSLRRLWSSRLAANEAAAPDLVAEMRGIAEGSGVPFERIFLLNSLLDVGSLRYFGCAAGMLGCTSFALPEERHSALPLIGQTYDLSFFRQQYGFVARIRTPGAPRQLLFTLAGMVGCAGVNEAGIGLVINYLSARDGQPGKLHAVIVRQALAAGNLADAVTAPVAGARAGGSHYLVADEHGTTVGVETTARSHSLFYADGRPYGHTNHYLADSLKPQEVIRSESIGSSIARYAALRRVLQRPDLDREALRAMTASHDAFPRSICAHGHPTDDPDLRVRTIAGLLISLRERTLEICRGCPCEGEYRRFSL